MSMKVVLVAAAGALTVSPAFAMSDSQIVHHTGGPIPYSQLVSMDKSGYSARAHHKSRKTAAAGQSVAANTPASTAATPADQSAAPAAPAPATNAAPDASATPSPAPAAPDATAAPSAAPPSAAPQ